MAHKGRLKPLSDGLALHAAAYFHPYDYAAKVRRAHLRRCVIFFAFHIYILLIRQLNIEYFQMPANKPLACCPLPSPLPREREQVSAAGKRM